MEPKDKILKKSESCNKIDIIKSSDHILLKKYIHDIVNMRLLTREMTRNISDMTHDDKMTIILYQNRVIESLKNIFEL
jgi:hypothetical protein